MQLDEGFTSTYDKDGDAIVKIKDVEKMCANIFIRDNGRFDRDRFYRACQPSSGAK